jgi:hypothetical protein
MIKKLLFVLGLVALSTSVAPAAHADWAWNGYRRVWYCGPHCHWEHRHYWHQRHWHRW